MVDNAYLNAAIPYLAVRTEPDKVLREVSKPITVIDNHLKSFMYALLSIMHKEQGIGIAAIQVGIPIRAFIVQINLDEPAFFMLNPEIKQLSKEIIILPEGCLSVKTLENKIKRGHVERPKDITITYTDLENKRHELKVSGDESEYHLWLARCIQHEYDHLDGILFIDKLVNADECLVVDK